MPGTETATLAVYSMEGQKFYLGTIAGQLKYTIHIPQTESKGFLIVQIVTPEKTSSFNLLNQP